MRRVGRSHGESGEWLRKRVTLYDSDGINPYGRELALLLLEAGWDVRAIVPVDVAWVPAELNISRRLPGNHAGHSRALQILHLIASTLTTVSTATRRRDILLVTSTRTAFEEILFSVASWFGLSLVFVVHNPGHRQAVSRLRTLSRSILLVSADQLIAHSDLLADHILARIPAVWSRKDRISTCPLPPPVRFLEGFAFVPVPGPDGLDDVRALFFGNIRADKGFELLPDIFAGLAEGQRSQLTLVVCGWGRVSPAIAARMRALGVKLIDRTSLRFVPDHVLVTELLASDIVLAPYIGATQSASIALAITAGKPVLAFDQGSVGDLLCDDALVSVGDLSAYSGALGRFLDGETVGSARVDVDAWRDAGKRLWNSALEAVASGHAERSRTAPASRGGRL